MQQYTVYLYLYTEQFTNINKLYIVASCWMIIAIFYTMHEPLNLKLIFTKKNIARKLCYWKAKQ